MLDAIASRGHQAVFVSTWTDHQAEFLYLIDEESTLPITYTTVFDNKRTASFFARLQRPPQEMMLTSSGTGRMTAMPACT